MAQDLKDLGRLFAHAMRLVDAAQNAGISGIAWSFGGGAALMRRYRHRLSIGVDLFVPNPWMLGCLRPRLNESVRTVTVNYVEDREVVAFFFPEGHVAFIVGGLLTPEPVRREAIQGRRVLVQTSAEILARKLEHRAATFTARDLFDFAAVASREAEALRLLAPALQAHRGVLLERLRDRDAALREDFAALDTLEFNPTYDECVDALKAALMACSPPHRIEQDRARYRVRRTMACFPLLTTMIDAQREMCLPIQEFAALDRKSLMLADTRL